MRNYTLISPHNFRWFGDLEHLGTINTIERNKKPKQLIGNI